MQNSTNIKRSDIVYEGWVGKMPAAIRPYLILMRADRPIGTWLLLFPCWWSAVMAAPGALPWWDMVLLAIGAFVMRGAGCVMNDLADKDFDGQVARTATRPIPNGDVTPKQAIAFMGFLCLIGLAVLVQFNLFTIILGACSLFLVFIYPFCKRWTYWPQAILGLTFNWGALVGWSAQTGDLSLSAFCLYFAGFFWTLGYDTVYAHQDKEDDVMVGIKSTALRLGEKTIPALWVFYGLTMALIALAGYLNGAAMIYYLALSAPAAHLVWQIFKTDIHDPACCLKIFKSNKWFGWLLLGAIILASDLSL